MYENFYEYGNPVTNNELQQLEKIFNKAIPESFINHYRKFNGGRPEPDTVHDEQHLYPINSFLELSEIIKELALSYESAMPEGFNKSELMQFAYDPGSGIYAISMREVDYGKVYFYLIEEQVTVYGIWQDFSEFLNCISRERSENK